MRRYQVHLAVFMVTLLMLFSAVKAHACFFCRSSDGKTDGASVVVIGIVIGTGLLYLLRRITKK